MTTSKTPPSEDPHDKSSTNTAQSSTAAAPVPTSTFAFLIRLFFSRKFILHRLVGLAYLILFFLSIVIYVFYYPAFRTSPIVIMLPITGFIQSLTAIYTFRFLPKTLDPGYYGDKGVLSYPFVVENSFFSMMLMYQWLYYVDSIFVLFKKVAPFENVFVFMPYLMRKLWPKTSIRDALNNPNNKSQKNYVFFVIVTWITKIFYLWAKHFIGLFLNYVRFLDRVTPTDIYHIYFTLIAGTFSTTVAMFLHTLKFKKYMDPVLSYLIYMVGYFATFYGFYNISHVFFHSFDLCVVTLIGMAMNFTGNWQYAYQLAVMLLLNYQRNNGLATVQDALCSLSREYTSLNAC
jgi:hypothetical protein